jgi:hypothetical protein
MGHYCDIDHHLLKMGFNERIHHGLCVLPSDYDWFGALGLGALGVGAASRARSAARQASFAEYLYVRLVREGNQAECILAVLVLSVITAA